MRCWLAGLSAAVLLSTGKTTAVPSRRRKEAQRDSMVGIVGAAFSGLLLTAACATGAARAATLITAEEARLPPPTHVGATRGVARPTELTLVSPSGQPVGTSFPLKIDFRTHNGVVVDLSTVRVLYLREPAVDITARVKPYLSANGIAMPADAPPGDHTIAVELEDADGNRIVGVFRIVVKG